MNGVQNGLNDTIYCVNMCKLCIVCVMAVINYVERGSLTLGRLPCTFCVFQLQVSDTGVYELCFGNLAI